MAVDLQESTRSRTHITGWATAWLLTETPLTAAGPHPTPAHPPGKVWQRKVLADLQESTHFSSLELQALLNHFMAHSLHDDGECDRLDRDTFFSSLSQGELTILNISKVKLPAAGCDRYLQRSSTAASARVILIDTV